MADDIAPSFPHAESLPHLSRDSVSAPWAGRRMYASSPTGAKGSAADETESGRSLRVEETAMWGSFLTRIIKTK